MTAPISYNRVLKVSLVTILTLGAPLSLLWMIDCISFSAIIQNEAMQSMLTGVHHFGNKYYFYFNVLPGLSHPLVGILGWEVFGFLAILFPLWFFESAKRVKRVSTLQLPFSENLAAMAFFIPFRQLVLPHNIINSLMYRVSPDNKSSKLLVVWSGAWITMLIGSIIYTMSELLKHHILPWNIQVSMIYGAATVFCALGAAIVLKFERNIAALENRQ